MFYNLKRKHAGNGILSLAKFKRRQMMKREDA